MGSKARPRVPAELASIVLYKSSYVCCVCRTRRAGPHLHHLDGDPTHNEEANLAPLCGACHDEAHTKRELSQNLTGDRISDAKRRWETEVALKAAQCMSTRCENPLEMRMWTYFNFGLILDLYRCKCLQTFGLVEMSDLAAEGIVNAEGFPMNGPHGVAEARTLFESWPADNARDLQRFFSAMTEDIIRAAPPVDLDAIWRIGAIRRHAVPGTLAFLNRRCAFRTTHAAGVREDRRVQCRARGVELLFQIDTWNVFSNSSLTLHFRGCSRVAALVLVRSVEAPPAPGRIKLVIKATPVALGTGFAVRVSRVPPIAWKRLESDMEMFHDGLPDPA